MPNDPQDKPSPFGRFAAGERPDEAAARARGRRWVLVLVLMSVVAALGVGVLLVAIVIQFAEIALQGPGAWPPIPPPPANLPDLDDAPPDPPPPGAAAPTAGKSTLVATPSLARVDAFSRKVVFFAKDADLPCLRLPQPGRASVHSLPRRLEQKDFRGQVKRTWRTPGGVYGCQLSPDRKSLLLQCATSSTQQFSVLDLAAEQQTPPVPGRSAVLGKNGEVFFLAETLRESTLETSLYRLPPGQKSPTRLLFVSCRFAKPPTTLVARSATPEK